MICKEWEGMLPLHAAALVGSEEAIQVLLLDGTDTFSLCATGHTSLYYASQMGHESIVKIVLTKGSIFKPLHSQKRPEGYEENALNAAMEYEELPVVACLLELQLSSNLVNARGRLGQTATHSGRNRQYPPLEIPDI
ncbi:asparaginase-domain-containing protein [Penicillium angulare]|uniref:asparaginase-domain-containing protein n=1 Tax=Penicillium angulare TaxID=116970 RepID=UPI002540B46F|nr:asparaginase-domain-containing protein [Penicillium angulare]KAJ5278632.1 asparaginase-domain-containing protein [Penicillium angulare]